MLTKDSISDGDTWIAIGYENGTNDRVSVYGKSKEEVRIKAYGRAYALRDVQFFTMPPYRAPRISRTEAA